jgi:hypothetical protein
MGGAMGRRRLLIPILSFLVVVSGCVSAWREYRQDKYKSEPADITFHYPWEQVFNAYYYVLRNTAMPPILRVYFDDQEETIDILSDEVHFILRNKGQGYYEYTKANALVWEEEGRTRQTMRRYDDLGTPPR